MPPWWWTFGLSADDEIDGASLIQLLSTESPPVVVDVRTEYEFRHGHIHGARSCSLLPDLWSFGTRLQNLSLDTDTPVVCICLSAHRSVAGVRKLREMGFRDVRHLRGGMQQWRQQLLPERREGGASDPSAHRPAH